MVTLALFLIEYSRLSGTTLNLAKRGLTHTAGITLVVGFLSTMLGMILSILGVLGIVPLILLFGSMASLIGILYVITDTSWAS